MFTKNESAFEICKSLFDSGDAHIQILKVYEKLLALEDRFSKLENKPINKGGRPKKVI